MKIDKVSLPLVLNCIINMYFMLFINNTHIYFSVNAYVCIPHTCIYFIYVHIHDFSVCINVYTITFNGYITALLYFDVYISILINDISY